MTARTITLHQPWASLVAVGAKTIIDQAKPTDWLGPLLIHAGKRVPTPERGPMFVGDFHVAQGGTWLHGHEINEPMPFGAVVASCQLVDCVPIVDAAHDAPCIVQRDGVLWYDDGLGCYPDSSQLPFGDFTPGRYAWLLEDVKATAERCPRCWGAGMLDAWTGGCPTCGGHGLTIGDGICDPVPMHGKQGLWTPKFGGS